MLSHYANITAIEQTDLLQSQVVAHIIQTLHRFLPQYQGRIGISFPAYGQSRTLGGIIRLHGSETDLKALVYQLQDTGLHDYALIGQAEPVPSEKIYGHARFSRRQRKAGSDLKRARKRLTEQGFSEAEINQRLQAKAEKITPINLPHVFLDSASTRQRYLLAINKQTIAEQAGTFNSHGLSLSATVPLF